MTSLRSAHLLLLVPLAASCELVDYAPLVLADDVDNVSEPLAVAASGDYVWLTDTGALPPFSGPRRLVLADRADGSILLTLGPWTGGWELVDLATEYTHGSLDDVWVLHVNGWRTRWSSEGIMTGFEEPIPNLEYPAVWRTYCGLARDLEHGYTFLTTQEYTNAGYSETLWRHFEGTWERTPLSGPSCFEITYDAAADQVVTYDNVFDDVQWHDPENLSVQHHVELPEKFYDIVAFDHMTAVARPGRVAHYDANGSLLDTSVDVDPEGLHVHYGDNMVRLFFSGTDAPSGGPGAHAVGSWKLEPPGP